jgi:hypothetical protein
MRRIFYVSLAIISIVGGVIVATIFFIGLSNKYDITVDENILSADSGQVGDFIGGIVGTLFSLAGTVILILTLDNQQKSSKEEQFEKTFFEMLNIHRENVKDLNFKRYLRYSSDSRHEEFNSRRYFALAIRDVLNIYYEIKFIFRNYEQDNILEEAYFEKLTNQFNKLDLKKVNIYDYSRINMAYCIFFYGVDSEGQQILEKLFKGRFKLSFYKTVINYIKLKPVADSEYFEKWEYVKSIVDKNEKFEVIEFITKKRVKSIVKKKYDEYYYPHSYAFYYGGHQHRLGHYFRNLYQMVNYTERQRFLTHKQKYFYIKTLRAQMSTYEQILFFLNSLSLMGGVWELFPNNKDSNENNNLITKYNLIKNVPDDHYKGIFYKVYYPNVQYENEERI